MENQINVGDQNAQQTGQNSVNQPDFTPEKPKMNYVIAGTVVVTFFVIFGFGGYYLGKQSSNSQQYLGNRENQPSPTEIAKIEAPTTTTVPTVIQNSPSNTGTEDWKSYADKTYTLKYPSPWDVQPGSSNTEEYFGGDYVQILSPSSAVTIEIAPAQFAYGFEGPTKHKSGETFLVSIGGREYSGTEDIRTEDGKTKVYVNMAVPINDKEFHILFGTGYPVNRDDIASFSDYQKHRDTIIKILSTLTITN